VANREAKYGANFVRLGLSPGMAISFLLPRVVGPAKAAELMFTGELITGHEAKAIGLVSDAVAPAEVQSRAMTMAKAIAANAPIAVRETKRAMREGLGWKVREHAAREAFAQAATITTDDAREGIAALLEKRAPRFSGR